MTANVTEMIVVLWLPMS